MNKRIIAPAFFFLAALLFGQTDPLEIGLEDIRIDQKADGGFHLFIRKKPGIASVLLAESTRDLDMEVDNYAYRALEWNPINGDEVRILNGATLSGDLHSLIDSTPEKHDEFGEAFHIYIPYILMYGYEEDRYEEIYVVDGTFFNIRAFALPHGDYRGAFRDNPYELKVNQNPLEGPPEGNFMRDTVDTFGEIARTSGGEVTYSLGPEDVVDKIRRILEKAHGKNLDLVICLDTTGSMKNDIEAIRAQFIPMLTETIAEFKAFRIGMVLYKDYYEEYVTRVIRFSRDFNLFQRQLNSIKAGGGKDLPEAVHEALYDASVKFPWDAEEKIVILIGDAPPHPRQRGRVSKEMVEQEIKRYGLKVYPIILPQ